MSDRSRLRSGEPRKASQKRSRRGEAPQVVRIKIPWHPADRVRWRDRSGTYRRDTGDGEHVEIVIAERVYRMRRAELRQG
jgi:hypothetical protein